MGSANRALKNTFFLYARLFITTVLSFFVTSTLLRNLGVRDYGIYTLIYGVIAMLEFLNGTLASTANRYIAVSLGENDPQKSRSIFQTAMSIHIIWALLISLVLEILFFFLWDHVLNIPADRQMSAKILFQLIVLMTFCVIITTPYDGVLFANESLDFYSLIYLGNYIGKAVLTFALVLFPFARLEIYGGGLLLCTGLCSLIKIIFCRRFPECGHPLTWKIHIALFRSMLSFSGWNSFSTIMNVLTSRGKSILINHFFGVIINGAEGIASMVFGQLSTFASMALQAINPIIFKKEGGGDRQRAVDIAQASSRCSALLLLFFAAPVFFETPFLFDKWLPVTPPCAIAFCRIALLRIFFMQMGFPLETLVNATGKIRFLHLATGTLFFLMFCADWIFLAMGGSPMVCYWIAFGGEIIHLAIIVHSAKRYCELSVPSFVRDNLLRCLTVVAITFLLALPGVYFLRQGWWRLVLTTAACCIGTIAGGYWIGMTAMEHQLLRTVKNNFLRKLTHQA